jgi:TIR domain/SIR2-like domain
MDHIKDIIADIKDENCVLIIGPDIIDSGDKSFFETMCAELISGNTYTNIIDTAPQYVFANEELFQLMPAGRETTLLRMMKEFYQRQSAFDVPLTKISQIPFHLIISLMPDDRLQKLFTAQNMEFNYSYYPKEGAHAPVERPAKERPLIYNLLGDFKENNAIITFDHMFTFLSGIMGKRELPQIIQVTLKKAMTFVFIGVHFEKWYVQLLLRIITSNDKKDKYIILKNGNNNDVCTFIARRLELDFLEAEPLQFLEALYEECGNQNLLKTVNTKFKARIFISYSSADKAVVERIERYLIEHEIEVVRDETSSHAGQKIDDFINTIKNVDGVLYVASKNSLKSPWVCKEIVTTLQAEKLFVPCYIDKSFLDDQYWDEIKNRIKETLNEIGKKIAGRGTDSINDLLSERNDWAEFNSNLLNIKKELTRGISKSLMPEDFEKNISQVIQYILNNKRNA